MSLFFNFEKPGPGINPDEPRKTGTRRFFELLDRDGRSLMKAGLLALVSFLPWYLGMTVALSSHLVIVMAVSGIVGGVLVAPQLAGIADTALRALRDEPGVWWLTYKDAWKKNWKASLLPGAINGVVLASQIFALFHLNVPSLNMVFKAILMLSLPVFQAIFLYVWAQIVLYDMPFSQVLLNAVLLTIRIPLRSLAAGVTNIAYWAMYLAVYPLSLVLLPLTGLWFPLFAGLCIVYRPMEAILDIEQQIEDFQREKSE